MRTVIGFVFLLLPMLAPAATNDGDVTRYIAIFRGDKTLHASAAESLGWTGLSDTVKALATSGNPKYLPVVQEVAEKATDSKITRHARTSLDSFGKR